MSGPLTLALGYALFCAVYLGAAAWPVGTPATLQPSAVDAAVPFLPWTVWIYLSQFPYLALVFRLAHGTPAWTRTLRAMLVATLASGAVFVLYPTSIPRAPVAADAATTLAFAVLYGTDPAGNCLPSLHVSLALLAAAGFWPERRRLALGAGAWAALIAVSTLTTRQHYAVDVLAGALVALGAGALTAVLPAPRPSGQVERPEMVDSGPVGERQPPRQENEPWTLPDGSRSSPAPAAGSAAPPRSSWRAWAPTSSSRSWTPTGPRGRPPR